MPLSLQAGGVTFLSKGLPGDLAHGDAGKILDGGSSGERPMITSPLSLVKVEEHQRSNINSELGRSQPGEGRGGLRHQWSTGGKNPALSPLPIPGSAGRGVL